LYHLPLLFIIFYLNESKEGREIDLDARRLGNYNGSQY